MVKHWRNERYEDFHSPNKCPNCDNKWYTLRWPNEEEIKRTANSGEHWRYSSALGVFDEQLETAKKLHPQVSDWKKFGNSWRPLIKNRAEKKLAMKQANMYEYEPKDFNKGKQL